MHGPFQTCKSKNNRKIFPLSHARRPGHGDRRAAVGGQCGRSLHLPARRPRGHPPPIHRHQVRVSKKSGNVFRVGIFLDFVRQPGTTCAGGPHRAHVRGAKRNRIDRRSRFILPLVCRYKAAPNSGFFLLHNVRVVSRSNPPQWWPIRNRPPICACAPWGVRVDELAKSRKIPTRKYLPLFFVSRTPRERPCTRARWSTVCTCSPDRADACTRSARFPHGCRANLVPTRHRRVSLSRGAHVLTLTCADMHTASTLSPWLLCKPCAHASPCCNRVS